MLLWDFLVRLFDVCCIICDGICREGVIVFGCEWGLPSFLAIMRFHYAILCDFLVRLRAFCCIIFLRDFLKRFHAFLPLWDVLMKFVAFCCILSGEIFLWDFMFLGRYVWDVLVRFYAFWRTIFVRDILMRVHAYLGRYELYVWDFMLVWPYFMFFGCRSFFLMVWCQDGGEVDVEGCGR